MNPTGAPTADQDDYPLPSTGGLSVPSAPGRLAEAYDVLKPVGKGGYAIVFKGIRREDGRVIAVKKVEIFEMTQKKRERCLQEVTLFQKLDHPYIIQMYDAFIDENMLIIIFEWAPAGDLKRLIKKTIEAGKTLDEATIWSSFAQISDALRYMHQQRIMHRDIKPANVLVGSNGALKIGDLGLGRQLSEQTMEAFSKVGTPYYVSPEVVRGAGYDWKSDVWSLGCLLYELASLRSPFEMEGANLYDVFQKISKGDFQPLPPNMFSAPLRGLVARMLSVDPHKRPELEEVWSITQGVVQSQAKTSRQDVHSSSMRLAGQLSLLEADVAHKISRQNGKKCIDLPEPPTDALRLIHPLSFAEPSSSSSPAKSDLDQKRQLGTVLAVFAWLLRLISRAELAQPLEAQLEYVPAPGGKMRAVSSVNGAAAPPSLSPKPPQEKRSGSTDGNVKQRRSSRLAAENGGNGSPPLSDPQAFSPPRVTTPAAATLGSIRCMVPTCSNVLKGAEAIKKVVHGVGLSTEFAPVNAIALGYGRAICSILQDLLDVVFVKVGPSARKPKYYEDIAEAEEALEENGIVGGDDEDGAVIDASYPLPGASGRGFPDGEDDEEEAYLIQRRAPSEAGISSSVGKANIGQIRDAGRGGGPMPGEGRGPGRPPPHEHRDIPSGMAAGNSPQIDPEAWRVELERLAPRLSRILLPSNGSGAATGWDEWHSRWQGFKSSAKGISEAAPEAAGALAKSGSVVAEDLDRIAATERRLNSASEVLAVQYRASRQRLTDLQQHLHKREDVMGAGNASLADINARLLDIGAGMQECAGALDGGTQVTGIQASIRRLRSEMAGMDLRIGVLQQQLLAKQHLIQVSNRFAE